ncbi:hypothetical protein MRB53_036908 [Persea americana]|nr:hypothetical protein MRB53_036908 [Persea americana]
MVPGHMSYRKAMPRLMQEVGWAVESLEFSEIEDPDPDNHEARQRELIDEIEEARQELEKQPAKKRWGIFRPEEARREEGVGEVRREFEQARRAVELAAQGTNTKQQEDGTIARVSSSTNGSPVFRPALTTTNGHGKSSASRTFSQNSSYEYDEHADGERISMTFDTPSPPVRAHNGSAPISRSITPLKAPMHSQHMLETGDLGAYRQETYTPSARSRFDDMDSGDLGEFRHPQFSSSEKHKEPDYFEEPKYGNGLSRHSTTVPSPSPLRSQTPQPALEESRTKPHNVWADEEDDFGQEKEMSMTFE